MKFINIDILLEVGFHGRLFPVGLPINILMRFLFLLILTTFPTHFNLLDIIILKILGEIRIY